MAVVQPMGNTWCAGDTATLRDPCMLETIPKKNGRKVVSHFFGRNKAETKDITAGSWLRFCRKHYQHAQYRDPKNFSIRQCNLVIAQLLRIRDSGKFEYVKLGLRLRSATDDTDEADTADPPTTPDNAKRVRADGTKMRKAPDLKEPGPLPDWLREQLSDHVTFDHMYKILRLLRFCLEQQAVKDNMPDIEILPVTAARDAQYERQRENQAKNAWRKHKTIAQVALELEEEEAKVKAASKTSGKTATPGRLILKLKTSVPTALHNGATPTPSTASGRFTPTLLSTHSNGPVEAGPNSNQPNKKRSREEMEEEIDLHLNQLELPTSYKVRKRSHSCARISALPFA